MQTEDNSLSGWFQGCIEKIHSTSEESDLRTEFQDLFTGRSEHKPISISDLKKEGTASTETVAGSYVVTRSLKFRIRAAPAQRKSHVVFSAKVKKQPGEGRKISELYLTMLDKAVPVSLPYPE